jgi:phage shock protein C
MYCTRCGIKLDDKAFYCSECGTATGNARPHRTILREGRLSRSRDDAKIAGVCAGVARHFGWDVSLVRAVWLILAIWPPTLGVIAYLVCWIVMPRDPLALLPAATESAEPAV